MKDRENKAFWDRFAFLYGAFMKSNKKLYEDMCELVSHNLSKEDDVLEIACGTGQMSFLLCEKVKTYTATDFSEEMIKEAEKESAPSNLKFKVENAVALTFPSDSFDAVVISNALHIMPEPQKALSEIRRVLKDDGFIFAPTFTKGEGLGFKLREKVMYAAGFKVFYKWSKDDLEKFIGENGFEVVESKMMGSKVLPMCYLCGKKGQRNKA